MGSLKLGTIDGVTLSPRRKIPDERGSVFHHLKSTDAEFVGFGESYISTVFEGSVKAWRRHRRMTQLLVVPVGKIRFLFVDDRPASKTSGSYWEATLGENEYSLLRIPPNVWYCFQGVGPQQSLIVNCASEPHDPAEIDRREAGHPGMPQF